MPILGGETNCMPPPELLGAMLISVTAKVPPLRRIFINSLGSIGRKPPSCISRACSICSSICSCAISMMSAKKVCTSSSAHILASGICWNSATDIAMSGADTAMIVFLGR